MDKKHVKLLVLGSGPAGYTAALYASRANMKPLLLTGLEIGGQLTTTTDVENWPGDANDLQGPDLMERMKDHVKKFNTEIIMDQIKSVDLQKRPFELTGDDAVYTCDSLIIATGASAKYLGLESEKKYLGKGVSACATCDGFFYRDQEVVVVGGGNTAVEEALYLSNICEKVFLIHRRDKLRAEMILQERLFKKKNIHLLWNKIVKKFVGDTKPRTLRQVDIFDKKSNQSSSLKVDGVFVAIGHSPSTEVFSGCVPMDKEGYIYTVDNLTQTKIDGVFAAGDVSDKKYRQAITAAGFGCMSAIEAESFLSKKNII